MSHSDIVGSLRMFVDRRISEHDVRSRVAMGDGGGAHRSSSYGTWQPAVLVPLPDVMHVHACSCTSRLRKQSLTFGLPGFYACWLRPSDRVNPLRRSSVRASCTLPDATLQSSKLRLLLHNTATIYVLWLWSLGPDGCLVAVCFHRPAPGTVLILNLSDML